PQLDHYTRQSGTHLTSHHASAQEVTQIPTCRPTFTQKFLFHVFRQTTHLASLHRHFFIASRHFLHGFFSFFSFCPAPRPQASVVLLPPKLCILLPPKQQRTTPHQTLKTPLSLPARLPLEAAQCIRPFTGQQG
ncbi:unnamed protein product, partial [Ectocarpus sp. 4 AP-2014]